MKQINWERIELINICRKPGKMRRNIHTIIILRGLFRFVLWIGVFHFPVYALDQADMRNALAQV